MLSLLQIQNLALIQSAKVEFGPGFNVLTGETGAGKSILLGAVSLLLGGRASAEDIRTGEAKASVEGIFEIQGYQDVSAALETKGIGHEEGRLFIRREIHREGRNRVFLNGSPVPLSVLVEVGDLLIDVHGQHEHQSLLRPEAHLETIDSFKETAGVRAEYNVAFRAWESASDALQKLLRTEESLAERRDMLSFRVDEIGQANTQTGEDTALEQELRVLESSAKRAELCSDLVSMLSDSDASVVDAMRNCLRKAEQLAALDSRVAEWAKLLESASVEADEAGRELSNYGSGIEHNPDRIEEINERLSLLSRLKKKHGGSLEQVLAVLARAREELGQIEDFDEEKSRLRNGLESALASLGRVAQRLSNTRAKVVAKFNTEITKNLRRLSMDEARFQVRVGQRESEQGVRINGRSLFFDATGVDQMEMMISPNPGEPLKPLIKIASGGELSRVMLAIKSFIASVDRIPSLVFDEIDVGIGGRVSAKIGEALSKLGRTHQILCVTHLPPIAAKASLHYTVTKQVEKGRTRTFISQIDQNARIKELARMLGNETSTSTRKHAEELVGKG